MKVAIINTVIGTGSVGRIACGTADEIMENGGSALLCRGRGEAAEGYENYRIGSDLDMAGHGVLTRVTDRHGLYSRGATRKLIRRLEEYDPDVIQLHNVHGYYVNYPLLFDRLRTFGKPVVWTLHDCWSFTGHCAHFEYCGCDKWCSDTGCFDCPEKNEYPASYMRDASKTNFSLKKEHFTGIPGLHLVTPSEWLKEALSRSFLSDYPVSVINTGIDLEVFRPVEESDIRRKHDIGDRKLILGVANPWRETKGMYDFAALYEMLEHDSPGRYKVAMIGLKPSQTDKLPEGIIKIIHTDSVTELAQWYSAADFYVNLTYGDTFPTTNIEALACGTPVITYDAGGSGEIVTEATGAVVEKTDIKAVEETLERMSGKDMRDECVKRASHFAKRDKYKEYYELYQAV
ncbi:MAG: glycosyltransferase [Lachnospiraceae bacterium]|nr:glycosyltransferase [Lachnospiraceae bacterium]